MRGGELTFDFNGATGKSEQFDRSVYNWCRIICLTLVSTLSGLCFGYDTAVVGGATLYFVNDFPSITKEEQETVVSLAILGASLGALVTGQIADKRGRKFTILLGDYLMIIGTCLMCFAPDLFTLGLGRLVAGLGFGTECMACSVFLAEVSPRQLRGSIVTANIACCVFGQLLALIICILVAPNWRLMLGMGAVPAALQALLSCCIMPETPYFLMRNGKRSEAEEVIKQFYRDEAACRQEIAFLHSAFSEEAVSKQLSYCEAFKQLI